MSLKRLRTALLLVFAGTLFPALGQSGGNGEYLYWMLDAGQAPQVEWRIRQGGIWGLRDFRSPWAARMVSLAAARGHNELLALMLDSGSDVNAPGELGFTPLVAAATGGHTDTIKLLLARGASVNAPGRRGATALIMAAQFGNTEAVRLLLDKGADPRLGGYGTYPLIEAAKSNKPQLVRLLLQRGAAINVSDSGNGYSALMWCAHLGFDEVVRILLGAGAALELKSLQGYTALSLAVREGNLKIAQLLRKAGAKG